MDIILPDGRKIEGIPEGTTKRDLVRRLRKGGLIDNAAAAQMLGIEVPDVRAENDAAMPASERFLVGVGRGGMDVVDGVQQLAREGADLISPGMGGADEFTAERQEDIDVYNRGDLGLAGGLGRVAGNVAAGGTAGRLAAGASGLTQLERAGAAGRAMANAAGGAAGGASMFVEEGGSRAANAMVGGALGVALAPVAGAISNRFARLARKGGRKLSRPIRLKAAMEDLKSLPDLSSDQQRQIAIDIADGFTPEQAMRKFELEQIGVVPTRGRVTGDLDDLRFEVDERRVAGEIADTEQASRRGIDERMRAQVDALSGGADVERGSAGDAVTDALAGGRKAAKAAEGAAYTEAGKQATQTTAQIRPSNLAKVLEDEIDFLETDSLRPVAARLRRIGVLDSNGEIIDNVLMSPQQSEAARRVLGSVFEGNDPNAKRVAGKLRAALLDDVTRDVGGDVYSEARKLAADRFAQFDNKQLVNGLLTGKVGPEQLVRRIQGAGTKAADVADMMKTLDAVDDSAANLLRASVLDDIFTKARGALDVDEVPTITPATFAKKVDAVGMAKLEALYGRPQAEALKTFSDRLGRLVAVDPRTAGPGTAGDAERKLRQLRTAFGRLLDMAPMGRWVTGAFQAVEEGSKSRRVKEMTRRALNLELLKRENVIADLLEPRAHPGLAAGASAISAGSLFGSPDREETATAQ